MLRLVHDWWCDVGGACLALFCRVEQVAESTEHAALPSRLHHRGEIIGSGLNELYVRFEADEALVSLPPQLLRLLPEVSAGADAPHMTQELR